MVRCRIGFKSLRHLPDTTARVRPMFRIEVEDAKGMITTVTLLGMAIAAIFLTVMAISVRYVDYIADNPGLFALELTIVSVVASVPIFYVAYVRDSSYRHATVSFLVLVAKFALLWLLMELSGVNSLLFPPRHHSAS